MRHHVHGITLAFVSVFLALASVAPFLAPEEAGKEMLAQVSAVGVSVGILPNEFNSLAADLRAKEEDIRAREADLALRERYFLEEARAREKRVFVYVAGAGSLLLALLALNFYFDWADRRREDRLLSQGS